MKGSKLTTDPFAAEEAVVTPVGADDGEQIRITLKGGSGYDAPWITVDFPSIDVAYEKLSDTARKDRLMELFAITGGASSKFIETSGGYKPVAPSAASRAPQGAQSAPGGETRQCVHGEMVFKSGVSKAGNPYKMFACPAPRDQQCKAQFL